MNAPGKILIADRNRHVREFLQRELEAEGYQVTAASKAETALKLANDKTYDLDEKNFTVFFHDHNTV